MLLLGVILFLVAVLLGLPISFALLMASAPTFLTGDYLPTSIAVQKMVQVTQSYPLMAIPFFVVAGNIMAASGIARRLVDFSRVLVGWMVGGLAQVSIILSLLMGGIAGSAVADTAMQSRLLGGPMIAKGYSKGFTAGVIAYSSIITATIPPSIGLIVYGFIANQSVGKLLLGGIIPGLILTAALMSYTYFAARHYGYGADEGATVPTRGEVYRSGKAAFARARGRSPSLTGVPGRVMRRSFWRPLSGTSSIFFRQFFCPSSSMLKAPTFSAPRLRKYWRLWRSCRSLLSCLSLPDIS